MSHPSSKDQGRILEAEEQVLASRVYNITKKDLGYLSKVQSDVDLVELQPPGKWRALPPAFCPINGICYGVGLVAVCGGADVAVLALLESTKITFNCSQKNVAQSRQVSKQFRKYGV